MSLHSGKRINMYTWAEFPMPNEVIEQIHRIARAAEKYEGIPLWTFRAVKKYRVSVFYYDRQYYDRQYYDYYDQQYYD